MEPDFWRPIAAELEETRELDALELGALWALRERAALARLRVDAQTLGEAFLEGERRVEKAVARAVARVARRIKRGELRPAAFRAHWQSLGYAPHPKGQLSPADDFLHGLIGLSRHVYDPLPALGTAPNIATRAERIAEFLEVTAPKRRDVVVDLGAGSGKFALTVAASTTASVLGVELFGAYVVRARRAAKALGLRNVRFTEGDVRTVDLGRGNLFYLYLPFIGDVARDVAVRLGGLAKKRALRVFAVGPGPMFGEYFEAQPALRLEQQTRDRMLFSSR